jgi:hypothetical protein
MAEQFSVEQIAGKIYFIRSTKVMLDRDLAELYGVETRRLKEQVRRNIERFPDDFMFELTQEELKNWRSQFATSSDIKFSKRVHAFTKITLCPEQKNRLHHKREAGGLFPKKSKKKTGLIPFLLTGP